MNNNRGEPMECEPGKIFSTPDSIVLESKNTFTFSKNDLISNDRSNNMSNRPRVYKGLFNGAIPIALKAYQTVMGKEIQSMQRDLQILSSPEYQHPNLIRYFGCSTKDEFKYLATELCECSVADVIERGKLTDILNHLSHQEILLQSTQAVAFLHSRGKIHRNLHPDNFLLAHITGDHYLVKLTDFHCTKDWVKQPNASGTRGSDGWIAPESSEDVARRIQVGPQQDRKLDVFILGCFYYYVLSGGKHPFGEVLHVREANVRASSYSAYQPGWNGDTGRVSWGAATSGGRNPFGGPVGPIEGLEYSPKWETSGPWWQRKAFMALDLIKQFMIRFEPYERKELDFVLDHPYFKSHHPYILYDDAHPQKKPGLCVIVSQEKFHESWEDVPGMSIDAESLWKTFTGFGYDVLVYKNLTKDQMVDWIQPNHLRKENDLEKYNSLVVCILSHGGKGTVMGVDGGNVEINQIKYAFNGGECEELNGKPKIFIILACQGSNPQTALRGPPSSRSSVRTTQVRYTLQVGEERPPLIDHLSLMATIEEFYAFAGDWGEGSPFIQSLCDQLQSEYGKVRHGTEETKTRDLLQLFHSEVIPRVAVVSIPDGIDSNVAYKQTPESRSSLLRTIRFRHVRPLDGLKMGVTFDGTVHGADDFKRARNEIREELEERISQLNELYRLQTQNTSRV